MDATWEPGVESGQDWGTGLESQVPECLGPGQGKGLKERPDALNTLEKNRETPGLVGDGEGGRH